MRGERFRTSTQRSRKDGVLVDVALLNVSVDGDGEDGESGIYAIYHDITELQRARHQAEAARQQAEQANKAKTEFVSEFSHELKTAIRPIDDYSALLHQQAKILGQEDLIADMQKITNTYRKLKNLVENVGDLSTIESGTMPLELQTFDVMRVVNDTVAEFRSLAAENDVELIIKPSDTVDSMVADQTKVVRALRNLLSNACKFTVKGDSITVTVDRESKDGKIWVTFKVHDTGIGVTPEYMQDGLFQERSQATPHNDGMGLGLAISHRSCRRMGGDITVESEVGQGSTFTIHLPAEVHDPTAESVSHGM